jgi:hypothetical protein
MNAFHLNASRRRSKMLISAAGKMTAAAAAFAVFFGAMAYAHCAMNESLCHGVRMVFGVAILGATIGLIAGGGIVVMSNTKGAISSATLARILLASLVVGAICAAIGVPLSSSIGDARFAAFIPAMLGLAGVVIGLAAGTVYVAGDSESEEPTAPRTAKLAARPGRLVHRESRSASKRIRRETSSVRRIVAQIR